MKKKELKYTPPNGGTIYSPQFPPSNPIPPDERLKVPSAQKIYVVFHNDTALEAYTKKKLADNRCRRLPKQTNNILRTLQGMSVYHVEEIKLIK